MSPLQVFLALILLAAVLLFVHDRFLQKRHSLLRNYPVIGRFRYFAEFTGEHFRQYHYLNSREGRPYNRLERNWVYRSAKGVSNLISFGSEADPSFFFKNAMFPRLDEETNRFPGKWIGKWDGGQSCETPYFAKSIFNVSPMSYGALSHAAVESLSRGAAKAGIWLNTGEGGLSDHHLKGGCDIVFQIGTAKYGVIDDKGEVNDDAIRRIANHDNVKMFEIKLAQGAKPGKGGILPGAKVTAEIARVRGIKPGEPSVSPNRHKDISNPGELVQAIRRLRDVAKKPVGIKIVVGQPAELENVLRAFTIEPDGCPDFITVDGGEGGTGAAPEALADHVGLPLPLALPIAVKAIEDAGLKERIRVIASGHLATPDNVAWALCHGADFAVAARGFLFSIGCIQALKCKTGKCPTGVTASDPKLIRGLDPNDKFVRAANYAERVNSDIEIIAHSCGLKDPTEFRREHLQTVSPQVRTRLD
jgi:glutamate synthase domain-containing protein 2